MRGRLRERPDEIPAFDALSMSARIGIGLLDAVRRMNWPVGRLTMSKILAGSQAKGMDKYARHPYFGRLQTLGQAEVDRLYKQLLLPNYLRLGGGEYPIVELTPLGAQALEHREDVGLAGRGLRRAPPRAAARVAGPQRRAEVALDADGEARFETLRAWRTEQAREREVPPYVVFSDKTLRALAAAPAPTTRCWPSPASARARRTSTAATDRAAGLNRRGGGGGEREGRGRGGREGEGRGGGGEGGGGGGGGEKKEKERGGGG